jgi:hypothetical protein
MTHSRIKSTNMLLQTSCSNQLGPLSQVFMKGYRPYLYLLLMADGHYVAEENAFKLHLMDVFAYHN